MHRIKLLGCPLDIATMEETLINIENSIENNVFTQHSVVNVAKLVNMRSDNDLRDSVSACDIINIDGMGIVLGARFLGFKVNERVAGIDLFYKLLELSEKKNYPVFLLGAEEEVLNKTITEIKNIYKDIKLSGFHHGYFWDDEESVVKQIRDSGAKLLFVAITSPKKENFINKWHKELGVSFVMGVGGTFDIVAGKTSRAPKWMQERGLEWLFRLLQEPERMWKRYLVTNTKFAFLLIKESILQKIK